MKLYFETNINLSYEQIRDRFNSDLFIFLSRGLLPFKLKRFDGCKAGDEIHIELGVKPFSMLWISDITYAETNASGWSFIDQGKILPWPLIYWKHHHRVDRVSEHESRIVDDVEFSCKPSIMGPVIKPLLWFLFALRPRRYKRYFEE
jgi:ligand-binding SRPBCC domain-containing protein